MCTPKAVATIPQVIYPLIRNLVNLCVIFSTRIKGNLRCIKPTPPPFFFKASALIVGLLNPMSC